METDKIVYMDCPIFRLFELELMFSNFGTFLFRKLAQPFSLIQTGQWVDSHFSLFKGHVVTVRDNLVIYLFSSFHTFSET